MATDPFVVNVSRLRRSLGTRRPEVRRGPFDPDGELQPDAPFQSAVPAGAECSCDVVLESFSGGVMVSGTVRAPWVGVCRRCAVPVSGELSVAVRERFCDLARHPATSGGPGGRQAPEDDEAYPIEDDQLDLGPLVREAVLLELPPVPLCQADCLGLCPSCGADRNVEDCTCVAPVDPRWAILSLLRSDPEGERPSEHAREAT